MNEINPQQLLDQIRTLNAELKSQPDTAAPAGEGFGTLLKSAVDAVNESQQHAMQMKTEFVSGTSDASLVEVLIAAQKADLSFRAMTEVRNKLISAYQEIMNMPV